jgi:tetratricopeptide (TPR) repeat protein
MIGLSLANCTRNVTVGPESPSHVQPNWGRSLTRARCPALVLLALLLSTVRASSQTSAEGYRQTVLSIQQQIEAGNLDSARTMIAAAARKYPSDGGLDNLLGVVEIQEGHVDKARQDFAAAIRRNPRLAGASLNLSRIDMQTASDDRSRRNEARRLSQRVLQLDPSNDEAKYQLATIFAWDQSYQRSLDYLETLSERAREQVGSEALLCLDETSLGHPERASKAATALAANPDLTEQDAMMCLPALRTARRADLIEMIFASVAGSQALSATGLRVLGLAMEAEGKLQQARATLEGAFAADGKSAAVLIDLTRVAEAANDHKGALGYLAHARELQPEDASLAYEFGVICLKMDLYGEGRKAIAEAVKIAPGNPSYNYEMGMIASRGNDPSEALPYLNKFHSLRPQEAAGILALGVAYFRAMDYDSALKWLKQAVPSKATAADAHFYLGRIARLESHLDEATREFKQSLSIRPDSADVLAELGTVYLVDRDYAQAAPCFERAIQLDPDNYVANFGLLELYARTGDERRDRQSKRFDEIKEKKEQREREMMRTIEIRRDTGSDNLH